MNWRNINIPLGNIDYKSMSPSLFGIDDAILVGGALGFGGSIVGGLFNKSATNSANATNLQAVRETNKANLDLYREQFADQYKMWQENNAYNDPGAQMSRLRSAGLNPAAMMLNGGANQAQAMSVPSANPMQSGHVEPSLFNYSDVGNTFAQMASGLLSLQKSQGEGISNTFLARIKQMELKKTAADIKVALQNVRKGSAEESLLKSQLTMANLQNKMFSETFDQQKQNFQLQNDMISANTALARQQTSATKAQEAFTNTQNKLAGLELDYKPNMLKAAISETMANIGLLGANKKLSVQQAKEIYQRTLTEKQVTKKRRNENALFEQTFPYVIQAADLQNQKTESEIFRNQYESSGFKIGPLDVKFNTKNPFSNYYNRPTINIDRNGVTGTW